MGDRQEGASALTTMIIDGKPATAASGATTAIINPVDGSELCQVPDGDGRDVDRAVEAAAAAFPEWSRTSPAERAAILNRLAVIVDERSREFSEAETDDAGKPIRLSTEFDVPGTIDNIAFFAGAARHLEGKAAAEYSPDHTSMIRREPIGVVGSVVPWNYPLQMAAWKLLPAVGAGNTLVLKPSQITPMTAHLLVDAAAEAGLPPGVVNLVLGKGSVVGQALMEHPGVAMVSLTGSTETGAAVMSAAASTIKRVHLELGGKAPFLVHEDADLAAAIQGAVAAGLINCGQDCTAATRAYVHSSLFDDFTTGVAGAMAEVTMGNTRDPGTDLGPLVSRAQQERVAGFVRRAVADGARALVGGSIPDGELEQGAFFEPTLIVGADQRSEIVQSEIFGPVLVAIPFDDDDEGYRLANDIPYGLAASVWTRDVYRAMDGAQRLEAGTVWVNDHIPIVSEMPHGGYKTSGSGKDQSMYSFEEYTQIKHVMIERRGDTEKEWHRTIWRRQKED